MNSLSVSSPIKIAINAQLPSNGGSGGTEYVLIGLISALGKLSDGEEEYVIIGPWENTDWLKPYLGPNQRLIRGPNPEDEQQRTFKHIPSGSSNLGRLLHYFQGQDSPKAHNFSRFLPSWSRPFARRVNKRLHDFVSPRANRFQAPLSNGFYENLGCDVIHFPNPSFILCALPMIYNPHDLLHLHYPQFFTPGLIQEREAIYPPGCHYARVVVAGSQWIKNDLVKQYGLKPKKIQVIPWGAPTQAISEPTPELIKSVEIKYNLPSVFAFYPAMLWEHKNHLRLLEALAYLRDQKGLIVCLVCTGSSSGSTFWPKIEQHLQKLNLNSQAQFIGIISSEELRAIYKLSQFVIVPTLFEAASAPVFEAWHEGIPVACSTVTSLPEQAGNAALLFDPFSVEAIAEAVQRMATDEQLRSDLVQKGHRRLMDFSWERTAKAYRAVYRCAAGYPLTDEDRLLLSWDWMRNPKNTDKETL